MALAPALSKALERIPRRVDSRSQRRCLEWRAQTVETAMRSPFVDSASFLSEPSSGAARRHSLVVGRLLMLALVMAVAASSAVLLAI
jgi:hypothetical protein